MFANILVPIDGSQPALKAVGSAAEIARRFDSRVTLVHVQQLPGSWLAAPGMYDAVITEASVAAFEECALEISPRPGRRSISRRTG